MVRVFANGLEDRVQSQVKSYLRLEKKKKKQVVFDASLLNTQHYKI